MSPYGDLSGHVRRILGSPSSCPGTQCRSGVEDAAVRVVKVREGGIVHQVRLLDDEGCPVEAVCRFLEHLADRGSSPNTLCAYGYDLRHLFTFLEGERLDWREFGPADTLRFLGYLRRLPSGSASTVSPPTTFRTAAATSCGSAITGSGPGRSIAASPSAL